MEILQLIFQTLIFLFILYLVFAKSYFSEKGKNLATNEDIEELTRKVESVKQDFGEKNTNLKAKLDLLTNLQFSHKNDERSSIITFHKTLKRWISLLTESVPSLVDDDDEVQIREKIYSYRITKSEVENTFAILELYVSDEKLISTIKELIIEISNKLSSHAPKYLVNLKYLNKKIQLLHQKAYTDEVSKELNKLHQERLESIKDYQSDMLDGLKQVVDSIHEYDQFIKQYLSQIAEDDRSE